MPTAALTVITPYSRMLQASVAQNFQTRGGFGDAAVAGSVGASGDSVVVTAAFISRIAMLRRRKTIHVLGSVKAR